MAAGLRKGLGKVKRREHCPEGAAANCIGLRNVGCEVEGLSSTVYCDNLGVVQLVNSGYSRVPQIMHLLRCLFFIRAYFELELWAVHIPGKENTLADAISHNDLLYFFSQVPGAANSWEVVPLTLLSLQTEQQPDWTSLAWTRLFRSYFTPA